MSELNAGHRHGVNLAIRRGAAQYESGIPAGMQHTFDDNPVVVRPLFPERPPATVFQPCGLAKRAVGTDLSEAARERLFSVRGEPLLIADWDHVLMIHYEVNPTALQRVVPFELDLWDGGALVTVVAFTMRGMRPYLGGRLSTWMMKPIATHEFLNVRTYVRHRDETGIYFMAEWLSNRLSVALGPIFFGLPYSYGRIEYRGLSGSVHNASGAGDFSYCGRLAGRCGPSPCESGSLPEWLMERYTAFTCFKGARRFFRVWHAPWRQVAAEVSVTDQRLLDNRWPSMREGAIVGVNYSTGVRDVWMGRPHRIETGFDAG